LAIVEFLLLPESEGATNLFLALGADPTRLPLDVERDLYGAGGLFDRLRSGASEQLVDDAFFAALPWPRDAVEAGPAEAFARIPDGTTFNDLRPHLIALDGSLANIENLLEVALERGLFTYTVPASTLYSPRAHTLRRSEVEAMLGVV